MNQYHEDGHSICAFLRLNYYLEKTNANLYTDINKLTIGFISNSDLFYPVRYIRGIEDILKIVGVSRYLERTYKLRTVVLTIF
jgi:hypothetical protein